jgi:uncharacterized protein (DUF433 family)
MDILEDAGMINLPEIMALPLKADENDTVYISGTRVTLDTLIARYQQGDTPEAIHKGFPGVPLSDIYSVVAYYLAHQEEVDTYLEQRDKEAERIRQNWEARNPTPSKAELMARMKTQKPKSNEP